MSNALRQLRHVYYKKLYIVYYSNRPAVTSKSPSLRRSVPVARSRSRLPWEAIKKPPTMVQMVRFWRWWCVYCVLPSPRTLIWLCLNRREVGRTHHIGERWPTSLSANWIKVSLISAEYCTTYRCCASCCLMYEWRERGVFGSAFVAGYKLAFAFDREKKLCSYVITKLALKLIEYFQKKK